MGYLYTVFDYGNNRIGFAKSITKNFKQKWFPNSVYVIHTQSLDKMKTLYYMKRRNKERVHLLTDNVYLEFFSHLFCSIKFI